MLYMAQISGPAPMDERQIRRLVGVIAVVLLIVFTILSFLLIINLLEWIIGDVLVVVVANLIFRRLRRQPKL